MNLIPKDWLPAVPMQRIIVHWTAGAYDASAVDRKAYHVLIGVASKLVRGVASIALNSGGIRPGYAAHTLNCNSGSIGVSICCMASAQESPFNAGRFPMLEEQFETLAQVVAQLCRSYGIPVTPQTVLSHAEVQSNLGITQRGKWDYTRLPWALDVRGARTIGDRLRARVLRILDGREVKPVIPAPMPAPVVNPPIPAGGTARVVTRGSNLMVRRQPSATAETIGTGFPNGQTVEVLEPSADGQWARVKALTAWGTEGWVSAEFLDMIDGPAPSEPTKPDPRRVQIADLRRIADELEKELEDK